MSIVTNREALIQALQNEDDENDSFTYMLSCPYYSDEDCKNPYEYRTFDYEEFCRGCKMAWLDKEFEG